MKVQWFGMLALGAATLIGCGKQGPAGGPGVAKSTDGSVRVTKAENTFKLGVPSTETDVKQGQAQTVRIAIKRGEHFDQDVKLEFKGAPKGVTVSPATTVAKSDMKEVAVQVEATPEAPLGEFKITVTGVPAREGEPTSADFQVEVKKAD